MRLDYTIPYSSCIPTLSQHSGTFVLVSIDETSDLSFHATYKWPLCSFIYLPLVHKFLLLLLGVSTLKNKSAILPLLFVATPVSTSTMFDLNQDKIPRGLFQGLQDMAIPHSPVISIREINSSDTPIKI